MVVIRLSRSGAKKNPYYFITVADSRNARDGAFIERLGFYNPSAKGQEETLRIDIEKVDEWVSKGAQVSDRVKRLIKDSKLSPEELDTRKAAKKDKADAKKAAALAAKQEEIKKQAEEVAEEEASAEEEAPAEEAAPEEAPVEEAPAEEALSVTLEEKTPSQIINEFESKQMKTDLPEFRPGDTVVVSVKVREGERTRLQAFEGVVMGVKKAGLNSSFIVRKISSGIGVERTFQTHSPMIDSIQVKRKGDVRQAKLFYLRERSGKSARIKERLE